MIPQIEDKTRYTAPPDPLNNGEDSDELGPYDQGFEDRVSCRDRMLNPYRREDDRAEYFKGWDNAEKIGREVLR